MVHLTVGGFVRLLTAIAFLINHATSHSSMRRDVVATEANNYAEISPNGPFGDIENLDRMEDKLPRPSTTSWWEWRRSLTYAPPVFVQIPTTSTSGIVVSKCPPDTGGDHTSWTKSSVHFMTAKFTIGDICSPVSEETVEASSDPHRTTIFVTVSATGLEETVLSTSTSSSASASPTVTFTVTAPADRTSEFMSTPCATTTRTTKTRSITTSILASSSADKELTMTKIKSVVFSTTVFTATSTSTRATLTVILTPSSASSTIISHMTSTQVTTTPEVSISLPTTSTSMSLSTEDTDPSSPETIASATKSTVLCTVFITTTVEEQASNTKSSGSTPTEVFTTPTLTSCAAASECISSHSASCTKCAISTSETWTTTFIRPTSDTATRPSNQTLTITGTGGNALSGAKRSATWSVSGSSCGLAILIYYLLW